MLSALGVLVVLIALAAADLSRADELPVMASRVGLKVVLSETLPVPVDLKRMRDQKKKGCDAQSQISFGDTALTRGTVEAPSWSKENRRRMAALALVDDPQSAYSLSQTVLADPKLDPLSRLVVENQYLMTALQFGDAARFRERLEEFGEIAEATPLKADRLFLRAYEESERASSLRDWLRIDSILGQAHRLDPSFFSVLAYRVVSWLRLQEHAGHQVMGCRDKIKSFSTRVLDVSQASACPLLVAHFDHMLARTFELQALHTSRPENRLTVWRAFAMAILAKLTGNEHSFDAAEAEIVGTAETSECAGEILSAVQAVGDLDRDG